MPQYSYTQENAGKSVPYMDIGDLQWVEKRAMNRPATLLIGVDTYDGIQYFYTLLPHKDCRYVSAYCEACTATDIDEFCSNEDHIAFKIDTI